MGAAVSGIMIMISAAIVTGIITGGVCGIVNGRLRAHLFAGLLLTTGVYLCALYFFGLFSVVKAGVLPMIVTFLVPNWVVPYLEHRRGMKPAVAVLAGLASVIVTGALFLFLFATRYYPFSASLWIASGIIVSILLYKLSVLWRSLK